MQKRSVVATKAIALLLFTGILGFAPGCSKDQGQASTPTEVRINAPAPNFTLSYHGAPGQMSLDELRGKVVMVNFWASWCPACRSELPDIASLYRDYKDRGFEVLGVVVDSRPEEVDRIINDFRIPYPSVTGNDGMARMWHVSGVPTTYVIDREGVVRAQYIGARQRSTFERDIVRLLAD